MSYQFRYILIPILFLSVWMVSSCKKEYSCICEQTVATYDTTFTLTGEGRDHQEACDEFDSEETEFGITKTVDCEPINQ